MLLAVRCCIVSFHVEGWILSAGGVGATLVADINHVVLSMLLAVRRLVALRVEVTPARTGGM